MEFDAEQMLNALTDLHLKFRETLTPEEQEALWKRDEARVEGLDGALAVDPALAEIDFEHGALIAEAEQFTSEIEEALSRREQELYAQCLEIFYVTEELSRDPAHKELVPRVEEMRKAHWASYGKAVPPRH